MYLSSRKNTQNSDGDDNECLDADMKMSDVRAIRSSSLADERREAIYLKHSKGAMVLRSTSSPKDVHRNYRISSVG